MVGAGWQDGVGGRGRVGKSVVKVVEGVWWKMRGWWEGMGLSGKSKAGLCYH